MYRNRTRRHHRAAVLRIRRTPHLVTAQQVLRSLGFADDFARRYAAQVTKTAKKYGTLPAGRTRTTVAGRARVTAVWDLTTQAVALLRAACTYKRTARAFGLAA